MTPGGRGRGGGEGMRGGAVHVLRDGKPTPIAVRVGATDGSFTEVVGPLKAGDQLIVGGGPKPPPRGFGGGGGGGPGGGGGGGGRGLP
jgi:HlyD family secretion protein